VAQAVLLHLRVATRSIPSLAPQPTMPDMNLSTELLNAILTYLGNRPYVEVVNLITAIQVEAAKTSIEKE